MKTKTAVTLSSVTTPLLALVILTSGCRRQHETHQAPIANRSAPADPLMIALAPHEGSGKLDVEIRHTQDQVRLGDKPAESVERLGWLFVAKARESFDPGYFKLAEQCALSLESVEPHQPAALLLRGHVLQSLHRFKEAEPLARELVEKRGLAFDFGLLGDVLMEQGRLNEAVETYQKMADLKPDLHAYARAAHIRWLKGDLDGAIEMMQFAVQAATPRDPETAAWVCSRMAQYQLQAGNLRSVEQHCAAALEFRAEYAPALLVRGKLLLAKQQYADAAAALNRAAELNPIPEYQWTATEAARQAGLDSQLNARLLESRGAAADPRTFSLYLASCGRDPKTALRLAKEELNTRADVFTHDAVAWALAAGGDWREAEIEIRLALAEGTHDSRLFLHAGIIASESAQAGDARRWLQEANSLRQMLLPSEQAELAQYAAREKLSFPEQVSEAANLKIEKNNQIQKGRS